MTIGQIDLVEISEAFAAQVIPLAKQMGIAMETLNIHNGAIALGHPFGMTGAHIITTLIYGLQHTDKGIGLEPMCVGGGQGMAMIIERLNKFRYLALYGIQVSRMHDAADCGDCPDPNRHHEKSSECSVCAVNSWCNESCDHLSKNNDCARQALRSRGSAEWRGFSNR